MQERKKFTTIMESIPHGLTLRTPMKRKSQAVSKLNPDWVKQALEHFKKFLQVTKFPHPVRNGSRGSTFEYPEWLIMFIAVLATKEKVKSYLGIHALAREYWALLADGTELEPISERQLRDRLKKIGHTLGKPAAFISQIFPEAVRTDQDQRRQDDGSRQRSGLASKTKVTRHHSQRPHRLGS